MEARTEIPPLNVKLSRRQKAAWDALRVPAVPDEQGNPGVRKVAFGGAKGGGKSRLGVWQCYVGAAEIATLCGLQPSAYPPPIGFMGRAIGVDFTSTTLETWKAAIPADTYVIRDKNEIVLWGGVCKIDFGGLDSEETRQKFNSAEYCFVFVDQAEEVSRDDIGMLQATLRRKPNDVQPPYWMLFTLNPAMCWARDEFYSDRSNPNHTFIESLPSDNPFLATGYVQTLKESFRHRPELLQAYLYGSWDSFVGPAQIIKDAWLAACMSNPLRPLKNRRLISCDPARFGDDETCIGIFENTVLDFMECYGQRSTDYTATRLAVLARERGDCLVVVDEIGLGAGIVDQLHALGVNVMGINSSSAPSDTTQHYGNLRAEMWDTVAKGLADKKVDIHDLDSTLRGQLTTPNYDFRRGKLWVEEKEDIKDRLGRSPDRADMWVMGQYALRFAKYDEEITRTPRKYGRHGHTRETSWMAG